MPDNNDSGTWSRQSSATAGSDARARAEEVSEEARAKAEGIAMDAKEKAGELSGQARETAYSIAESGREGAAGALDSAAERLEDRAASSSGMQAATAERAAQGMQAAAGYLQEHDTAEIWDDLEQYVKTHPLQSVAAAVAAGLVIGRALR
jgi:ElaB/YqjD/DUF883 family membrane-anchored ribosome-binding protein